MPDLGQPLVKEVRRLAAAYAEWPGPDTARPSEVLEWHSKRVADDEDRGADEASAQDSSPEVARATRRQVLGGIAAVGAAGAHCDGLGVSGCGVERCAQGGGDRRRARWAVVHL